MTSKINGPIISESIVTRYEIKKSNVFYIIGLKYETRIMTTIKSTKC